MTDNSTLHCTWLLHRDELTTLHRPLLDKHAGLRVAFLLCFLARILKYIPQLCGEETVEKRLSNMANKGGHGVMYIPEKDSYHKNVGPHTGKVTTGTLEPWLLKALGRLHFAAAS